MVAVLAKGREGVAKRGRKGSVLRRSMLMGKSGEGPGEEEDVRRGLGLGEKKKGGREREEGFGFFFFFFLFLCSLFFVFFLSFCLSHPPHQKKKKKTVSNQFSSTKRPLFLEETKRKPRETGVALAATIATALSHKAIFFKNN